MLTRYRMPLSLGWVHFPSQCLSFNGPTYTSNIWVQEGFLIQCYGFGGDWNLYLIIFWTEEHPTCWENALFPLPDNYYILQSFLFLQGAQWGKHDSLSFPTPSATLRLDFPVSQVHTCCCCVMVPEINSKGCNPMILILSSVWWAKTGSKKIHLPSLFTWQPVLLSTVCAGMEHASVQTFAAGRIKLCGWFPSLNPEINHIMLTYLG